MPFGTKTSRTMISWIFRIGCVAETIPTQLQRWIYLGDIQSLQFNILVIVVFLILVAIPSMTAERNLKFGKRLGQRICSIITRLCLRADSGVDGCPDVCGEEILIAGIVDVECI